MSKPSAVAGFGPRLIALREKSGLTQEGLARELQFSSGTVSRWEREVGSPQAEQLLALADFFNVTTDHLLRGTTDSAPPRSLELHRFLPTMAGQLAAERGLLPMLAHVPGPTSVELYRHITGAVSGLLALYEKDRQSQAYNSSKE
jgi:transcriptional regulator with XRE-family HTH domain